jgi:hypothetical protein
MQTEINYHNERVKKRCLLAAAHVLNGYHSDNKRGHRHTQSFSSTTHSLTKNISISFVI